MSSELTKLGRFVSLVLRHNPSAAGVQLDAEGWVEVDALLKGLAAHGRPTSRETLDRLVRENDKARYAYSEDGSRIRARQGHSLEVDLALSPQTPPDVLFHGTAVRFVSSILADGLKKMNRHHVHLSATPATAETVGARRGECTVLQIDAAAMHRDGFTFYCSENGVWLTDHVPPSYVTQGQHCKATD